MGVFTREGSRSDSDWTTLRRIRSGHKGVWRPMEVWFALPLGKMTSRRLQSISIHGETKFQFSYSFNVLPAANRTPEVKPQQPSVLFKDVAISLVQDRIDTDFTWKRWLLHPSL